MAHREVKEAFVSNLNGTSLGEVVLGSFLAPVCLVHRAFILVLYYQAKGTLPLPLPPVSHLLLDFSLLVLPLVLSCTLLSDILSQVIVCLTVILACVFCFIYQTSFRSSALQPQKIFSNFLQSCIQFDQVPFVTLFRVFVNMKTAISILAVDFSVFPRRYAKTETYGTGVMDFGVGAFVFANALVSPEARRKSISGSKMSHITKQILSVWPLVALGLARLVSIKMTGYHEHVTEYGIHWNFFFTLAIVRVLASALLVVLPAGLLWLFALLISGFYQFFLETSELKTFLMHNNDREKDFVHANKEGIFSIAGYVAIYLAGVQIGLYVMQPRSQVKDCLKMLFILFIGSLLSYAALLTCQALVEPVSRRSANLPFVIWSVAQSLFFMSCLGLADMVILFSKGASSCRFLPSSMNFQENVAESEAYQNRRVTDGLCLIQAVSRNQLLFFLLANLMTGVTNSVVDTLSCSSLFSVCVLLVYMFTNCLVIYVLHICGITVKFW
ncbi:PREDICTED: phosphatidylinositol-glycan biosynthesis class W protein [Cyprinodon variegatus]|uniref:Phosphatidylinositol-glycan biosynthesis class W protein n=1 Tax=Cyprinodon variegatus TaxID=28743 RepID=A0A3Q2FVR0_CYPVA|nr:PREDICTED: phosphatidylinositol-glycan biosynthesis class W protein [Cyprinodon variegatus]XP_015239138.1 PREDICTED: phosphatidylinositol-glycan biosynthesis class W protein [Cyprinodon variegatus]XP_015239139.1 PREDICTED: phosphatidylinositol-glycan biosynthesis class W protein [Cyprinodon variegatus]